jgi:hypothetical protein
VQLGLCALQQTATESPAQWPVCPIDAGRCARQSGLFLQLCRLLLREISSSKGLEAVELLLLPRHGSQAFHQL